MSEHVWHYASSDDKWLSCMKCKRYKDKAPQQCSVFPRTEQEYFDLCLADPNYWAKYMIFFYIWFGQDKAEFISQLNKKHLENILLKHKQGYTGKVPKDVEVAVFNKLTKLVENL